MYEDPDSDILDGCGGSGVLRVAVVQHEEKHRRLPFYAVVHHPLQRLFQRRAAL